MGRNIPAFSTQNGESAAKKADKTADQAQMLANRLRKRYRHMQKWARRTGSGAFRLYDRDIPEIPLVLDWYPAEENAKTIETATKDSKKSLTQLLQLQRKQLLSGHSERDKEEYRYLQSKYADSPRNLHKTPSFNPPCLCASVRDSYRVLLQDPALAGALYQRPYEKDQGEETAWLAAMRNAAATALGLRPENVYLRERKRQRGSSQYGKIGLRSDNHSKGEGKKWRTLSEYGLKFKVNLSDYLDTGLFLDRRLLRSLIKGEAKGKRFLNLFCYTASLSVAAAAGGAERVDSVDLSNTYLDWAKDNFALNGFNAELCNTHDTFSQRPAFTLIRADVMRFLQEARCGSLRWDTIILDPPAFSNSKKMNGCFDLKKDHVPLIANCLSLLAPGGVLYLSSNVKGFTLDEDSLRKQCRRHNSLGNKNLSITNITEQLRDEDFIARRIPGTWKITI